MLDTVEKRLANIGLTSYVLLLGYPRHILWNSIALTYIVVTELANTMKYGGGGLT